MTRSGRRNRWSLARLRPAGASALRRLAARLAPGEDQEPVPEPADAPGVAEAEATAPAGEAVEVPAAGEPGGAGPEAEGEPAGAGPGAEGEPAAGEPGEPTDGEPAAGEPGETAPGEPGAEQHHDEGQPAGAEDRPVAGEPPSGGAWTSPAGVGLGTLAPDRHVPVRTAPGRRRSGRAYPSSRRSTSGRGRPVPGGHRAAAGRAHAAPEPVDLAAGYRLWLPAGDDRLAAVRATGEFEPEVTGALRQVLTPGAVMVDVGASFGAHTVGAARLVGPGGRVLAFEPAPAAQSLLLLNVAANGLGNVEVDAAAVGPGPGAMLRRRAGGAGPVPFDGSPESLRHGNLVVARTLDRAVASARRVDLVRVGSAAAVAGVLSGGTETLFRHRPALLFPLRDADGAGPVMAFLGQAGYRVDVAGAAGTAGGPWLPFARVEALVQQARRAPAGVVQILALPAGG